MLFSSKVSSSSSGDPFVDAVMSLAIDEGVDYTSISALKNSDVFTAVKTIAQDIASSPIILQKNGIKQKNSRINYLLNKKPNNHTTGWHQKFGAAVNMLLTGNGYIEIIADESGEIAGLDLLKPSTVSIIQNEDRSITYRVGNEREIPQENMLHYKTFTYDSIIGKSPLISLKTEVALQEKGNKNLLGFFKNGINSSGILTVKRSDLDAEAKQAIREKFEEANAGDENALRTIVIDSEMEYEKLEVSTEVLKLVNNNIYSTKQIAKAFGIPLERMGLEMTNTSSKDADLLYLKNTLTHYFAAWNAEQDVKLLEEGEWSFGFDTTRLLEVDPETKTKIIIEQTQNTLLMIDEARASLGRPPLPNGRGQRFLANLNYVNLDIADKYQLARMKDKKGSKNVGGGEIE